MALDLVIGEQVSLPPAGKKSLILDASGDPFLLTSAGEREALGGDASAGFSEAPVSGDGTELDPYTVGDGDIALAKLADFAAAGVIGASAAGPAVALTAAQLRLIVGFTANWFTAMDAFIASTAAALGVTTLAALPIRTELQDLSQILTDVTGTGVAGLQSAATNGGVLRLASGTTAGGQGRARNISATVAPLVSNARTGVYALTCRQKVLTNPAGTGSLAILNMTDEATADSGIKVTGAAPTFFSTTVGGATTATAITHGNAYHDIVQFADGTNIRWYVDTVLVATVLQSGAANAAGRIQMLAANGDQNANTESHVDKIAVYTPNPT